MIGRRVIGYGIRDGIVQQWEPLSAAMTDALVEEDGRLCWHSSHTFVPIDGLGPLPSRQETRDIARARTIESLKTIREQHIKEWHKPWPGCEFAKAIVGKSIDGALDELERQLNGGK